jgi:hypothetical protein
LPKENKSHLCYTYGGVDFAMKAEFKKYPIFVVSAYLLLAMVILGFGVRIGERN